MAFSSLSRRYNNLFCLAQHAIQASGEMRELQLSTPYRPANIRIHGTMYRKIHAAAESNPLRYLVVDPQERHNTAASLNLDSARIRSFEKRLLLDNPFMKALKRVVAVFRRPAHAQVRLEWHEGVNEVAAIVDAPVTTPRNPRTVVFHSRTSGHAQYLDPMSCLYEPLSYPLWFPSGGRGWGPDVVSASGGKLTQMWWYRQLLLRMSYMHACGRLLNEWLINMYCRMEDERFSVVRSDQYRRIAMRRDLCEVVANEAQATPASTKKYYLPASVPGSPRHLRRLRADALEMARRLGVPTFFVTLTCNPYWPEILRHLLPGQTAADRPDVVVRVFHAKLEVAMEYLKSKFCGKLKYYIKVIEYQRRGLPHAHIVLCAESPPATPSEVDEFISCELPSGGPVRELASHKQECLYLTFWGRFRCNFEPFRKPSDSLRAQEGFASKQ